MSRAYSSAEFGLGHFFVGKEISESHGREHTNLVFVVKRLYANPVLDNNGKDLYHYGMNELGRLRRKAKLTQTELAEKLGTQQAQISRWEKNTRLMPFAWAFKAGEFFGVHPGKFRSELLREGLDALLADYPEIKNEVRQFAEFRLRQSGL